MWGGMWVWDLDERWEFAGANEVFNRISLLGMLGGDFITSWTAR